MESTPVTCKCEEGIKLVLLHRFLNIIEVSTLSLLIICKKYSYWKEFVFSGNFRRRGIKPHIKCWKKKSWSELFQISIFACQHGQNLKKTLGYCCPSPTSFVKISSLLILGSVPYLWALFGCRDLPNLIPSFSFTWHLCSFCYKTVTVRSRNSLRLAQIKNEGVSLHGTMC